MSPDAAKFIALAAVAAFEYGVEVYALDEAGVVWMLRPREADAWTPLPTMREAS